MTYRELLGFTPNMGMFEMVPAWALVPDSVKASLPSTLVSAFDALSTAVGLYIFYVNAYNGYQTLLAAAQKISISASFPAGTASAGAYIASAAGKVVRTGYKNLADIASGSLSSLLDSEIPV